MADTPEAGPSRPKRARFRPQASNDAAAMKVDNVDVEKYALSRGIEISAMEKAMKASRDSGAQRAFQSLPRHLRRRAASHNIRRLPKRLRAKAKYEMLQDQAKALKKRKFRQLPINKRRKLIRSTRLEILHGRQREKAWLETHIWHAKRMRMVDTWGYRLVSSDTSFSEPSSNSVQAYTPTEKAFRPSYRASMHGVIAHDASYFQTLEFKGTLTDLKAVLSMICDPAAIPPYSARYSNGMREGPIDLYQCQMYPAGYIGPATVIWNTLPTMVQPSHDDQPIRRMLLRFHPSILGAVAKAVEYSISYVLAGNQGRGVLPNRPSDMQTNKTATNFRSFCTFEITGPMASDTIKACLRPVAGTSQDKLAVWKNLMPPGAVPTGTIISLDVQDPRLHFPPNLSKSERSHSKSGFIKPSESLAENSHFWDAAYRKDLVALRYSKQELDQRRAKHMILGTRLEAGPEDNSIPIMLVQRSIGPGLVDKEGQGRSTKNAIFGWTLIVPSGWGSAFWHSLAFADTRIGGLRERAQQYFEAGCPSFPEDHACTNAFKIEIDKKAKDLSARWHRTPAAKRVNYTKLKTDSPWRPAFTDIASKVREIPIQSVQGWTSSQPQHAPYLIGGKLLPKILPEAANIVRNNIEFTDPMVTLQTSFRKEVNNSRIRRGLTTAETRVTDAFVKVRLNPLTRGSPKYNAIIYMLTEPQVYIIRDQLKAGKTMYDIGSMLDQQEDIEAEEAGRRPPERNDWMEDDAEYVYTGPPRFDTKAPHVFPVPPSTRIMGYITTGNMSLARGKGQGLGAVSLVQLAHIMAMEQRATLFKSDLKLLVLFKNPASQFCRLATLEVLE